ncbi:MFS transporter [Sphingomonas crocodyli]|nr:MFS transporter [Sphingomonas crocodyli]
MKVRHTILSTLFVTWIVSFLDRMALPVALPYVADDLHLSPLALGFVLTAFHGGYALSQIPGGLLADRFGVRRVATLAMLWWSVFTAITGSVGSLVQMMVVRFLFGLGEGLFPACAFKTVAVWFPKKERATANAIQLASNPLGAALSPLIVVWIMSTWGWRAVFHTLFFVGIIISFLFWKMVRDDPSKDSRLSSTELSEIEGDVTADLDAASGNVSITDALRTPNVVKYFTIAFFFGIANWGFMTWLPTYLVKARGFSMVEMGVAASLPFFAGSLGALSAGWASDNLFATRRRVPVIGAIIVAPILMFASMTAQSTALLVICQTLTGFFLLFFHASFWAFPMNTIPKKMMGIAGGFINMAAQIAAFVSPLLIGFVVDQSNGNYNYVFGVLISALLMVLMMALILPRQTGENTLAATH